MRAMDLVWPLFSAGEKSRHHEVSCNVESCCCSFPRLRSRGPSARLPLRWMGEVPRKPPARPGPSPDILSVPLIHIPPSPPSERLHWWAARREMAVG